MGSHLDRTVEPFRAIVFHRPEGPGFVIRLPEKTNFSHSVILSITQFKCLFLPGDRPARTVGKTSKERCQWKA
jgi:hypothetical protein